jgi:hypothetical protein
MHRRAASAVLALVLTFVLASPALAEGGFSSSFSGWLPGVSSRTWKDRNDDGVSTTIRLGGCRARASATRVVVLRIQLTKETPWYTPDQSLGRKDFDCHRSSSVTRSWGRVAAGDYHFTLSAVNGTEAFDDKVSASSVRVAY